MKFFDLPVPKFPLASVSDYRILAKKRVPSLLMNFLETGAFDEITLRKNQEDFHRLQLKRRVLKEVSSVDTGIDFFGQKMSFPLALAPVGFAGMYSRRGEVQAAKASAKANIPFSLSTVSICSLEEVAKNSSVPFWFQFFMFKDRVHALDLLHRAQAAGCSVLLLTVDLPLAGARHRYQRSRRSSYLKDFFDALLHPNWWVDVWLKGRPHTLGNLPRSAPRFTDLSSMRSWMANQLDQDCTWNDFEWLRENWRGKILVKGILEPEDALSAYKAGADGIVVSNHGARHLDGTLSTIAALPEICRAVKGKIKIVIDGGITNGLDIAKSLAVGADACMIGKAWIYGLAARDEAGVSDVLSILQKELKLVMAHLGVSSIEQINPSLVHSTTLDASKQ